MCTELDFDKIMLTCVTVLLCYSVAVTLGSDSMEERMVQSSQDQTGAVKVAARVQLRVPAWQGWTGPAHCETLATEVSQSSVSLSDYRARDLRISTCAVLSDSPPQ